MGDGALMGRQDEPAQLFYKFSLDPHVPSDHVLAPLNDPAKIAELTARAERS
jgi:hypothetical protein